MSFKFLPYLLLLITLVPEIAFTQDKKISPWELVFNIEYSNPGRSTYDFNIFNTNSEIEYHSRTEFRPSIQIGVNYHLNHSFFISGRAGWVDNGHLSNRLIVPGFDESTYSYRAIFLSTGTGLGYNSPTFFKKLNLEISTHIVLNTFLKEISKEPEFEFIDVFRWTNYLSSRSNLGLKFSLSEKVKIFSGISLDYNITPTTKTVGPQDSINNNILRSGFKVGMNYKL
jgi:hypothetical protein